MFIIDSVVYILIEWSVFIFDIPLNYMLSIILKACLNIIFGLL